MIAKLSQFTDVRVALVVGGLSLAVQATTLRSNPEIVVATPVCSRTVMLLNPASLFPTFLKPEWSRLWVLYWIPLNSTIRSSQSVPLSHALGESPLVCESISDARWHLPH